MNIDLGNLSEDEQEAIWKVMLRYEEFKKRDEQRVLRLKSELQLLRKRGALRPGIDPERSCARCRLPLGHIINTGALCRACKLKICKACREYSRSGKYWICNVCYKLLQINAASGEWFYGGSQKSAEKGYLPLTQLVRRSIRQARRESYDQSRKINMPTKIVDVTCCRSPTTRERSVQASDVLEKVRKINDRENFSSGPAKRFSSNNKSSSISKDDTSSKFSISDAKPSPNYDKQIINDALENSIAQSAQAFKTERFIDIRPLSPGYTLKSPAGETIEFIIEPVTSDNIKLTMTPSIDSENALSFPSNVLDVQGPLDESIIALSPSKLDLEEMSDNSDIHIDNSLSPQVSDPKSSDFISPLSSGWTNSPNTAITDPISSSLSSTLSHNSDHFDIDNLWSQIVNSQPAFADTNPIPPPISSSTAIAESSEETDIISGQTGNSLISNQVSPSLKKEQPFANEANRIPEISISEPKDSEVEKTHPEEDVFVEEDDLDKIFNPATRKQSSNTSNTGSRESVSLSLYSNAGEGIGKVVISGDIMFGVSYNYRTRSLDILIKQCRDLAAVESKKSRSDPYVKTYLLPDKSKTGKRKTKIRKNTLNPVFDETLKYSITASEIQLRTLWISVWHNDTFGRNNFLGEVQAPLSNEVLRDSVPKWYKLQDRINSPDSPLAYKGDIVIALRYQPPDITTKKKIYNQKGSLHVLVKEAHNLVAVRATSSDPFCKSYLLPEKSKNSKQKSQVIKRDCSPKWNHTFVFDDVTIDDLKDRAMELTIWDHDRLASNEFLGGVRLGLGTGQAFGKTAEWNDAKGEEIKIWQTMLNRPNTWVEETLELRPHMDYK